MVARLLPLIATARGRLGRAVPLEEAAIRIEEVSPQERTVMPPVRMHDADRARVTAAHPESSLAHEWGRIAGGPAVHGATRRLTLRRALATPWGVFTAKGGYFRFGRPPLGLFTGPVARRETGFYPLHAAGLRYFGPLVARRAARSTSGARRRGALPAVPGLLAACGGLCAGGGADTGGGAGFLRRTDPVRGCGPERLAPGAGRRDPCPPGRVPAGGERRAGGLCRAGGGGWRGGRWSTRRR